MATMDGGLRRGDALPSISHFDMEKFKVDVKDGNRFPPTATHFASVPLGSPTTIYSGPPPSYSSATSVSGYISPPESTTRRSTRDEQPSPSFRKSLPSIHEALGEKNITLPAPPTAFSITSPYTSAPPSSVSQSFPDGPMGPPNPFLLPALSSLPPSDKFQHNLSQTQTDTRQHPTQIHAPPPAIAPPPPLSAIASIGPPPTQPYLYPSSPRVSAPASARHTTLVNTPQTGNPHSPIPQSRSPPRHFEPVRPAVPYSSLIPHQHPSPLTIPRPPDAFQPLSTTKNEETRPSFIQQPPEASYSDTVKRHLEMFDVDIALNEINESSLRTSEFSRMWTQRHQQNSQSNYLGEALPGIAEIDEMLRQTHRVMENLSRMREMAQAQEQALADQRARLVRGIRPDDDFQSLSDEYRAGFSGGEGKKRRGKAAPPGRCHSCNRAETPEWRRGPDGARTLCNACGLHYAKLTRKFGANKSGAVTGSNLRPKPLEQRD